jgi:hypothetical protein
MREWKTQERNTFLFLKKETLSRKKQKEIIRKKEKNKNEIEKNFNLQRFRVQPDVQHKKQNSFEETGWSQFKLRPKNKNKEKLKSVNVATIHGIAKRLIAREWTMALGKKTSSKLDALEREAAYWKRRI